MKIAISMEMTRKLRDTWHAALSHEWYDFLSLHDVIPLSCHGKIPKTDEFDLIIMTGGNDMPDIKTWRDNNYPVRDEYERQLIQQCQLTRTPMLGVCRGFHFMNWALGGTHTLMDTPYDGTTVQLSTFEVVCHHSIQIATLAPGFEVVQQDNKGVVELALNKSKRMLGVGWHPERAVNTHTRTYILDLINTL
jgi:gamma-glutamyl-gamma-aminobutyrate hydrolase PuuD